MHYLIFIYMFNSDTLFQIQPRAYPTHEACEAALLALPPSYAQARCQAVAEGFRK